MPPPEGRGMPAEAREVIQILFADHAKIRRAVTMTEDGYMAVTESDDPKVAGALHKHVTQMAERLESGLQVRRWDPAFAEYVAHYKEMDHQFQKTEKGVRMVVKGRTPLAVRVAQNHAAVISAFAALTARKSTTAGMSQCKNSRNPFNPTQPKTHENRKRNPSPRCTLILVGTALAHFVNPNWIWLTIFVGANLLQSAFTGLCPAETILRKLGVGKKTRTVVPVEIGREDSRGALPVRKMDSPASALSQAILPPAKQEKRQALPPNQCSGNSHVQSHFFRSSAIAHPKAWPTSR
ncbi:MAG: DUF2892 domain-containing protein [Verrucomicrobiales bacterium]